MRRDRLDCIANPINIARKRRDRMRVLDLTLKKKWFDMIASGEKKEEYREIKPYWIKRLRNREYQAIKFRNGYAKDSPTIMVELKTMSRGLGIVEWGAPEHPVFILHLGEILD
jgi:hypothetical protein